MPNVLRATSQEREVLVLTMFQNGSSPGEVQDALKAKYGFKLNLNRLYALRKTAITGAPPPVDVKVVKPVDVKEAVPRTKSVGQISLFDISSPGRAHPQEV
jgi:hypothetical protein